MYRVYTTEAIVLGSKHAGEANSYFFLLTRELGHITAFAQGVRELKSKLRYSLEKYVYVEVSLIRGKEKWRLTNASKLAGLEGIIGHPEKVRLQAKLCALLERLVHGEEADAELFDELLAALHFLATYELTTTELKDYELLAVLRLLDKLGYIAPRENWIAMLGANLWATQDSPLGPAEGSLVCPLPDISKERKALLATINESLYHSQL